MMLALTSSLLRYCDFRHRMNHNHILASTMFHFRLSLLLLLTSCYSFTLGFFVPSTTVSSNTRLLVGLSFDDDITDDDAYFQLLKRATDCASEEEEECSLEESQFLLHQVESLSKLNVVSLTEMMENLRQKTSIADSRYVLILLKIWFVLMILAFSYLLSLKIVGIASSLFLATTSIFSCQE